jgi:hypothetical protein
MPALSILLDLWCTHKDEAEAARHFIPQTKQIKTFSCEAAPKESYQQQRILCQTIFNLKLSRRFPVLPIASLLKSSKPFTNPINLLLFCSFRNFIKAQSADEKNAQSLF